MKIKTSELTGPALDWAVAKTTDGTTGWRLMWVFSNGHIWHKDFLTHEEAIAYSEVLDLDVDPNIKTWSLDPLHKKDA